MKINKKNNLRIEDDRKKERKKEDEATLPTHRQLNDVGLCNGATFVVWNPFVCCSVLYCCDEQFGTVRLRDFFFPAQGATAGGLDISIGNPTKQNILPSA